MIFLVRTIFEPPTDLDEEQLSALLADERERSKILQQGGTIRQLWREGPAFTAWGLWQAESEVELATVMASLPCRRYMQVEVHPVRPHPNSIEHGQGVLA